jgi:hypothetical protein
MALSIKVKNGFLILHLRLGKPVPSKSTGKTRVIASTHGTLTTDAVYRGKHIMVNANAFIYPRETGMETEGKGEHAQDGKKTGMTGVIVKVMHGWEARGWRLRFNCGILPRIPKHIC